MLFCMTHGSVLTQSLNKITTTATEILYWISPQVVDAVNIVLCSDMFNWPYSEIIYSVDLQWSDIQVNIHTLFCKS